MTALIERLKDTEREANQRALEAFGQLVIRLGSDADAELTDVQEIIKAAGKSATDLENAVCRYKRFLHDQGRLAEILTAQTEELPKLRQHIEAAGEELKAAQQKYDQKLWPLNNRINEINQWGIEAVGLEKHIRDGANPKYQERMRELELEINQLTRQLFTPRRDLETARDNLATLRKHKAGKSEIESAERRVDRCLQRVSDRGGDSLGRCHVEMQRIHAAMFTAEARI